MLKTFASKCCSDIAIARGQEPKDILQLGREVGLTAGEILPYGTKKAKVTLSVLDRLKSRADGKYIVVAG